MTNHTKKPRINSYIYTYGKFGKGYYLIFTDAPVHPNLYALLTPVLVLLIAALALGFGVLFSSLTTKYRDLTFLLSFIVQLWMYATPVIYPLSTIEDPRLKMLSAI